MSTVPPLVVDHVGLVVADVGVTVTAFRKLGFQVSDPVGLLATDAAGKTSPLGQDSAHIVFDNAYLEISAPHPGSGNHLEPYLALGAGIRILCFASDDLAADYPLLSHAKLAGSPLLGSARAVRIGQTERVARFRWCAVRPDLWPGVIVAIVEHLDRDIVFAPELRTHPNGARRLIEVSASPGEPDLGPLAAALHAGLAPTGTTLAASSHDSLLPLPGILVKASFSLEAVVDGCRIIMRG